MSKPLKRILSSLFYVALISFFLWSRGPGIVKNWELEGEDVPIQTRLIGLRGEVIGLKAPYLLVFWATWCKPCEVELSRLQSLIQDGKIKASQVVAISTDSTQEVVEKAVENREYKFPVVWDKDGGLSSRFSVSGTPTLVVVGETGKIEWVTTGLSPTLGLRLQRYLNP